MNKSLIKNDLVLDAGKQISNQSINLFKNKRSAYERATCKTILAKQYLQNNTCKTILAKQYLQNNTCKTILTLITILFFLGTTSIFGHLHEIGITVSLFGTPESGVQVKLYKVDDQGKFHTYSTGASSSSTVIDHANVWGDINDTGCDYANLLPITDGDYILVINNKYFYFHIPEIGVSNQDFRIKFELSNSNWSIPDNGRGILIHSTGNWLEYSIAVKNDFGTGNMQVNNKTESIPSGGKTYKFIADNFPVSFTAIDQYYYESGSNYYMKYDKWWDQTSYESNRTMTLTNAQSATLEAKFKPGFNITVKNNTNEGHVKIDDTEYSTSSITDWYEEGTTLKLEALYHTAEDIRFSFENWSDNTTSSTYYYTPSTSETITAVFEGTPHDGSMNTSFYNLTVGEPIQIVWDQHECDDVTQYKVYRKNKDTGTGWEWLATRNNSNRSFTDEGYDYVQTGGDGLIYRVDPYYSVHSTWGEGNYLLLQGDGDGINHKLNGENIAENKMNVITEFSLSNSPNPFNPSTQIVVELPEASNVELSIYNSLGQHVKTLINKPMAKGRHKARFNADNLPSGLYISLLRTNKKVITNKMLLVK